jgi:uncharacterized membrane protein YgaE (UPF0421/DUF939 family)
MALSMDAIIKLSTPKKILILVAILGIITGLYLYTFFIPQQDELKMAKEKLNKLLQEISKNLKTRLPI